MKANAHQVGGTHYKTSYEHWDFVLDTGMGYLAGCATKYVSRWRKKGGLEDLKKALHYVNKSIEAADGGDALDYEFDPALDSQISRFAAANELQPQEADFCLLLAQMRSMDDLREARDIVLALMDQAEGILPGSDPVPVEDSNRHAERAGTWPDEGYP